MVTVILPDLDEQILDQARAAAAAQGDSLEDELSRIVRDRARATESEADRRRRAVAAMESLAALAERLHAEYGPFPSTLEMIREERDSW